MSGGCAPPRRSRRRRRVFPPPRRLSRRCIGAARRRACPPSRTRRLSREDGGGRGVSRVREKQQFDSAMATNPSRNGTRRLRASSRFATLDRREHRPPHVPVTPASRSASLSRSSPARRASSHASNHAGRVSLCRCAKTLAFDFTPATSAGPGTRGSPPLGMTFGETAFIASARRTRHSNVTRGERGGRSRGPGGRAARCAFSAGFEYSSTRFNAGRMPRQKAKAQKSRKLGRRTRAVDLVPRA